MPGLLTFLADEIGRAFALIWGGIGIAVKLNYEVMTVVVTVTTRTVQLLLLLTQKTAQVFSILFNDIVLFIGDVGNGVIAMSHNLYSLVNAIVCLLESIGSSTAAAVNYSCTVVSSLCSSFISGVIGLVNQFGNLLHLVKCGFILFGSSILFAITFIPKLIHLLAISFLHLIADAYTQSWCLLEDFSYTCMKVLNRSCKAVWNYFSDISIQVVFGAFIGIIILIVCKHLLQYAINNFVVITHLSIPSFVMNAKQRILNWYICILEVWSRPPLRENNAQIEILDEANDENGNDNNDNVPDLNLVQNDPRAAVPPPPPPPPALEPVSHSSSSFSVVATVEESSDSLYHIRPLGRRPITRSRRAFGLSEVVTDEEVARTSIGNIPEKNEAKLSPSNDLQWAKQLYKELQDEREGKLCIVCQDRPKRVILLPCRHMCLCDACRSAVIMRDNSCPMCRKPILDSLRVYA